MPQVELRKRALDILCLSQLDEKIAQTLALAAVLKNQVNQTDQGTPTWRVDPQVVLQAPPHVELPARPSRPEWVDHTQVARRSPKTLAGRAALIHSIAHIEFNAINLALDAVWRFADMPPSYYTDWLTVAVEEATHFSLLRQHLKSLHLRPMAVPPGLRAIPQDEWQEVPEQGWDYGDFPAHGGLWQMCERTADDVVARMALVPRTMEARGLDATPLIQAKLRQIGTADALAACDILDIVLRDEIGHVAIGNRWYAWTCARAGWEPVAHYAVLTQRHQAPKMKPPFNRTARLQAGFSETELSWLNGQN